MPWSEDGRNFIAPVVLPGTSAPEMAASAARRIAAVEAYQATHPVPPPEIPNMRSPNEAVVGILFRQAGAAIDDYFRRYGHLPPAFPSRDW